MKRIGITGKSGFIGSHLSNSLSLLNDNYEIVEFEDSFFEDESTLNKFVSKCDVIVHLAALNRHNDPDEIYKVNVSLVEKLIKALEYTNSEPHIIFSSSTQEERNNPYGASKKEGRKLLESWADKAGARFTGLIIPNVFGPFGQPFYNSFISTFSYQLCRGLEPKIETDSEVRLIYVDELVNQIIRIIESEDPGKSGQMISATSNLKVSEILRILISFKEDYLNNGTIPSLNNNFEVNLFNTFRSYIDLENHFPFPYKMNADSRGMFIEALKLKSGGQISYSTTLPGITRGNHFHTRKVERFSVIRGEAVITMRKINTSGIIEFKLSGSKPSFVDMPVWYTHNITNIGNDELITLFWINEFYNPADPDTFYEEV